MRVMCRPSAPSRPAPTATAQERAPRGTPAHDPGGPCREEESVARGVVSGRPACERSGPDTRGGRRVAPHRRRECEQGDCGSACRHGGHRQGASQEDDGGVRPIIGVQFRKDAGRASRGATENHLTCVLRRLYSKIRRRLAGHRLAGHAPGGRLRPPRARQLAAVERPAVAGDNDLRLPRGTGTAASSSGCGRPWPESPPRRSRSPGSSPQMTCSSPCWQPPWGGRWRCQDRVAGRSTPACSGGSASRPRLAEGSNSRGSAAD
jgi:hypothetical protein